MSRKIIAARITEQPKKFGDPMPQVMVNYEGEESEKFLFEYYHDEISFSPDEFVGLTMAEARHLKFAKDLQWLKS